MEEQRIVIDGQTARGCVVNVPGAPLVAAWTPAGFVMCGYLDIRAADRLGVPAAVVRGVSTVEDLLNGAVTAVSEAGAARGVTPGMTGRNALARFF